MEGHGPHLSYKRDQLNMRDYMDRRVTPSTCGPPPPCKQALSPLHPVSLTHKNPPRCKIIHGMRPVGCKEQSIDLKVSW